MLIFPQFMAGLANHRRKRGLPASVLDISMFYGIGYVRRIGKEDEIYGNLRKQGYIPIPEQDFHDMFAEAVLASRPNGLLDPEIITGLGKVDLSSAHHSYKWHDEPKFSHLTFDSG